VCSSDLTCPIPLLALPPPIKGFRVRALPRFAAVVSTVLAAGALAGTTPASAAVQPWIASVSAPSTYVLQPWERAAVQIDLTTTAPAQKVEIWAAAASAIPGDALRFEDVVFTPTDASGTHWHGELADLGGWRLAAGTYQLGVAGITWANDSGASVGSIAPLPGGAVNITFVGAR